MHSTSDLQIITGLGQLELQLRSLLDELARLRRRLQETEQENEALREQLKGVQNQLKDAQKKEAPAPRPFQTSDKSLKLVKNYFQTSDNPAELKEQIDQYIREIDRCIAHLSSSNTL
ncbi:MAG: hypothetical protein LH606_05930 [Cytophagaceae bacterium]|nr:hypothetical protein [Cytophagaceae bacterium]